MLSPIITPFNEDGRISDSALTDMENHLMDNGVYGLFPVGKCLEPIGELTAAEKEKLHKVPEDMKLL